MYKYDRNGSIILFIKSVRFCKYCRKVEVFIRFRESLKFVDMRKLFKKGGIKSKKQKFHIKVEVEFFLQLPNLLLPLILITPPCYKKLWNYNYTDNYTGTEYTDIIIQVKYQFYSITNINLSNEFKQLNEGLSVYLVWSLTVY